MTDSNLFRPMRRHQQQLSDVECIEILRRATSGTLALSGDNGYPYALPISFVYDDNHLLFHSAQSGHKIDAIRRCDKASFCIIDQDQVHSREYTTYYRSVIAFGHIHIVDNDEERIAYARLLGNKYNPNDENALQAELSKGLKRMHVIKLDIEHLTGKEAIKLSRQKNRKN